MNEIPTVNDCFLHGRYEGDRCPHPSHRVTTSHTPPPAPIKRRQPWDEGSPEKQIWAEIVDEELRDPERHPIP